MTMRTMFACLAAATALIALVVLDTTNGATHTSCGDANAAARRGLLAQADKGYDQLLAEDPDDRCGRNGKLEVAQTACARARAAAAAGAQDEARKEFEGLLDREPPNARACALEGLRDTAPPATTTTPTPLGGVAQLEVVVRGEKGDPGEPGRVTKIIIFCDVRKRRACRMVG
jgi:hypothetical protein